MNLENECLYVLFLDDTTSFNFGRSVTEYVFEIAKMHYWGQL